MADATFLKMGGGAQSSRHEVLIPPETKLS